MTKICRNCNTENHIYETWCIQCGKGFATPEEVSKYLKWLEKYAEEKRGRPPPQPCRKCGE